MHPIRSGSCTLNVTQREDSSKILRRCRLTEDEAIGIFQCKGGPSSATKTARAYAVSEKTVRDIWTGRTWAKETSRLDASRTIKVTQMGRPKGRRDSHPRKSRRESDSIRKESAKHHLGLSERIGKDGCFADEEDHPISRCQTDRVGSLDIQLLAWERHHSKAPPFHDPFHREFSILLSFSSQDRHTK